MKWIRFLLFPFSILYGIITSVRNFLFDYQFLKSTSFEIPIINVGNLSVGGTGKTPQVEYLVRLLRKNHKVGILSRGYKRASKGYVLVDNSKNASLVGDEPYQYFLKFPDCDVAVAEKRVEGVQNLLNDKNPEIIILDDAFQHRHIRPSFQVLLTRFSDLFLEDFLLPSGNLRESRNGAKRADCIVVTKCPNDVSNSELELVESKLKKYTQYVFFSKIQYNSHIEGAFQYTLEELSEFSVLLITGIANSAPLLEFLKDKKINYKHIEYPDHHNFSDQDIENIKNSFDNLSIEKKLLLTTEKDFVRLKDRITDLSYLGIATEFLKNKGFDQLIRSHLKEFE